MAAQQGDQEGEGDDEPGDGGVPEERLVALGEEEVGDEDGERQYGDDERGATASQSIDWTRPAADSTAGAPAGPVVAGPGAASTAAVTRSVITTCLLRGASARPGR